MRRLIIISIIVILATCIRAQTEIEENTAQDTLNIEQAVIDTLEERIDPKLLLVEMNNFIDEKRKMEDDLFLPHLIYKENFHLSSPFDLNLRFTKNGFSEIPFAACNLQTVQNNRNIYNTVYKRGNIFYDHLGYSLPVAITETYMGLGDIDMNNIAVSLMKGGIFGIPNFDMQLDYLGEKGIWLGYENEVSKNFHLHLIYDLYFARVHFDNSLIDQTLPSGKDIYGYTGYMYPNYSASNKENEYSFTVENNIIDFGFKYLSSDYKMDEWWRKKRDLMQFLVQKKLYSYNHNLNLSYEFVSENVTSYDYIPTQPTDISKKDNSYHILSVDHDSNIVGFKLGNTGFYQDNNNFQLNSEFSKKIFHGFSFYGEYSTSSTEFYSDHISTDLQHQTRSRMGGGIMFNPSFLKSKIIMGQHHNEDFDGKYYSLQNTFTLNLFENFYIKYDLWLRNEQANYQIDNNFEILSFPEWQMFDAIEVTYKLKHNNAIIFGIKHIYHSDYSYYYDACESPTTSDTQNIDAYIKIQLTDRFEISVDAINLTNNRMMFTNYDHPETHFNFNVHWIFAN